MNKLLLTLALLLPACHLGSEPAAPERPPDGQRWIAPGELERGSFRIDTAQVAALPQRVIATGRVAFDDARVAHVLSPVSGRVVRIDARLGQQLHKGDALATLVSPDVGSAVSDEVKARADLVAAEHDRDRQQRLFEAGAATGQAYEAAKDNFEKARAEERRALERLKVFKGGKLNAVTQEYTLTSPIDGRLVARAVNPGTEVQGQYSGGTALELFTVGSIDTVWLYADIAEADLARVQLGTPISAQVLAYPEQRFRGTVEWISPTLDPQLRTARIRCSLPNPQGLLKPEMFAAVAVELPPERRLAVPRGAITRITDHHFVFVPTGTRPDGKQVFTRRMVEVPTREGDPDRSKGAASAEVPLHFAPPTEEPVAVLSGLSEGEKVLVDTQLAGASGADEVSLAGTQLQSGRIAEEAVGTEEAHDLIRLGGRLTFDDLAVAHVFPPVGGRITQVLAQPGQKVRSGDPLAIIVSPDLGAAFSDVLKAKADLDASEHELKRQEELFAAHAGPERDLEAARDAMARNRAEYDRARQRTELLRRGARSELTQEFVLRSPIDGEVTARMASPGQEVQGQYSGGGAVPELFTVGKLDHLWLLGDVFEMDLPFVKVGDEVTLHLPSAPDHAFVGKVDWISDVLDPVMRTAKVRCVLANPDHLLRPEMYEMASLTVPKREALSVPREALLRLGESTVVFVETGADADGGRTFRRTPVIADEQTPGDRVPVLSGLKPGDRVATRGAIYLVGLF